MVLALDDKNQELLKYKEQLEIEVAHLTAKYKRLFDLTSQSFIRKTLFIWLVRIADDKKLNEAYDRYERRQRKHTAKTAEVRL